VLFVLCGYDDVYTGKSYRKYEFVSRARVLPDSGSAVTRLKEGTVVTTATTTTKFALSFNHGRVLSFSVSSFVQAGNQTDKAFSNPVFETRGLRVLRQNDHWLFR
jgi:hypothetical protein